LIGEGRRERGTGMIGWRRRRAISGTGPMTKRQKARKKKKAREQRSSRLLYESQQAAEKTIKTMQQADGDRGKQVASIVVHREVRYLHNSRGAVRG
jgi:16S rRNA C1402 (ribose-2'-O) methylase RsmI